jgi:HAE1 family hydrophobic/amphiphilic exporter-1
MVEIRGHDLDTLYRLARDVREAMASIPGVPEAQINREPGMPEMLLSVDRLKAASLGLNVSDIADAMETAIGGRRTSMYRQQGDEYNIVVRLKEKDRLSVAQVGTVPLVTVNRQTIPAEAVVLMRRQEGPVSIERHNQERIVTVSGTLGDRDLGGIVRDLQGRLKAISRPADYEFHFGGEYEEQQEAFRELTMVAILSLLLVYMVMAAQFESLRDPFIILFSIPLAAIGVILTLVLTQTTFNMQAFLGVIMLIGIVVNNAIVLIDYTNQLRREQGFEVDDAVVTAGAHRLRPVLMTAITTVLGLVPMALGIGEGAELQKPMARVVIGGLLSSTMITLVLVPVIYAILEHRTHARRAPSEAEMNALPHPQTGD